MIADEAEDPGAGMAGASPLCRLGRVPMDRLLALRLPRGQHSTRPRGSGQVPQVTHYSVSFVEANGLGALFPLLIPVVLTGLALLAVWCWNPGPWARTVALWAMAVLSIVFCVLGMFSFGFFFVPAALVLVITAIVGTFQAPGQPKLR